MSPNLVCQLRQPGSALRHRAKNSEAYFRSQKGANDNNRAGQGQDASSTEPLTYVTASITAHFARVVERLPDRKSVV